MSSLLTFLALGLLCQAPGNPRAELAQIAKKAQKVPNYAFQIRVREQNSFQDSSGTRGSGAAKPLLGQYQKGSPVRLQRGDILAYRQGDRMVYQVAGGPWQRFDPRGVRSGMHKGRPGQAARHGNAPTPGEAMNSDASRRMDLFQIREAILPTLLLADLVRGATEVTVSEGNGTKTYSGVLDGKAAKKLASGGFARGQRGPGGRGQGRGPDFQAKANFQVVVDASGVPQSIVLNSEMSGTFKGRQAQRKREVTITISSVGTTTYEIPSEATSVTSQGSQEQPSAGASGAPGAGENPNQ